MVGPAFALLLTKVLPLSEPHAIGLLIFSLAPVAPMVSLLARKARSDMDFTAALVPLAMVATVVLLPLLAPWLMKGLTLNVWSLAKPLLLLVLLPLVVCVAIKVYASPVADKLFPAVKRLAGLSTLRDARVRRGVQLPGHRQHGGQLSPSVPRSSSSSVSRTRVVSARIRPETGTAQRHGAGHGHPQRGSNAGGLHGLSGPGPGHAGDAPAVGAGAGDRRVPPGALLRVPGRHARCGGSHTIEASHHE
ncbi:MAG: hypothetical protein MZV64_04925 [Ignavibacteriales bacterium]|nr:hypothetical protein [Ignavibacteriales bacterium]